MPGIFFGQLDTALKTALLFADQFNIGAKAFDQILSLFAHPIGHVDSDFMPQSAAQRGKRDAGIAAGRLKDLIARTDIALCICFVQNINSHSIFNAAGIIIIFCFDKDSAQLTFIAVHYFQHRCAADQFLQFPDAILNDNVHRRLLLKPAIYQVDCLRFCLPGKKSNLLPADNLSSNLRPSIILTCRR